MEKVPSALLHAVEVWWSERYWQRMGSWLSFSVAGAGGCLAIYTLSKMF